MDNYENLPTLIKLLRENKVKEFKDEHYHLVFDSNTAFIEKTHTSSVSSTTATSNSNMFDELIEEEEQEQDNEEITPENLLDKLGLRVSFTPIDNK